MALFSEKLIQFYTALKPPTLPKGIDILHPQKDPEVKRVIKEFYTKYYSDNLPRKMMLGINPGRFGAGITGVNFTAPRQLTNYCGIPHSFGNSSELSAEFIYEMIERYGGPKLFYRHYFIGSASPLGFVQKGKNINYYDSPALLKAVKPFISDCLDKQFSFGFDTSRCVCIGGEKNFKFLSSLNEQRKEQGLPHFGSLVPVPHPRFILQYRRKEKEKYIQQYMELLK